MRETGRKEEKGWKKMTLGGVMQRDERGRKVEGKRREERRREKQGKGVQEVYSKGRGRVLLLTKWAVRAEN